MQVIEGVLPEEPEWRVLLTLTPGQPQDVSWDIAWSLARANRGGVVAIVVINKDSPSQVVAARETLANARAHWPNEPGVDLFTAVVQDTQYERAVAEVVRAASVDLLILTTGRLSERGYKRVACAVAMVRDAPDAVAKGAGEGGPALEHILVPTAGGPNSAHALRLLLPLTPETQVTALYVSREALGDSGEALGASRLRQTLEFVDASERIDTKLIARESVAEGIIEEANGNVNLVVIGASEESRLDQVMFGNIPAAVVEECNKPVMVMRQNRGRIGSLASQLDWRIQSVIPRKATRERAEIYARIRRGARPETPFFVLMALSAMIASLGLIVNSPAVVIGAMLVAPLMSPIIGTGLAVVLGDTRFLRLALGAVAAGAFVAVVVGMLAGLTAVNRPFTNEILSRTQPGLYDLGIALFSGMAAAYALSFSQAAAALPGVAIAAALVPPLATVGVTFSAGLVAMLLGRTEMGVSHLTDSLGALLLFLANFIAIAVAAALVFFLLGFRPSAAQKARQEVQRRSARIGLTLLIVVIAILGLTSYLLARGTARENRIHEIAERQVEEVLGAEALQTNIVEYQGGHLTLSIAVGAPRNLPHSQVLELQESMAAEFAEQGIADQFALTLSVFQVTALDPLVPPTPTHTPTPTSTPTPGPTATPTPTNTPTATTTPTATPTQTSEPTVTPTNTVVPTDTPTVAPSPTVPTSLIIVPYGANLRSAPGINEPVVQFLPVSTSVVLLDGRTFVDGIIWRAVSVDGLAGWVAELALDLP